MTTYSITATVPKPMLIPLFHRTKDITIYRGKNKGLAIRKMKAFAKKPTRRTK